MKTSLGRRWLSLLLTAVLCLSLAPAAWADGEDGGDKPDDTNKPKSVTINTKSPLYTIKGLSATLSVTTEPEGQVVAWESADEEVVTINNFTKVLSAHKPGETTVVAYLEDDPSVKSAPLTVVVSGIEIVKDPLPVDENGMTDLRDVVKCYGDARESTLSFSTRDSYTAEIIGTGKNARVKGLRVGTATIEVRANEGRYIETFTVQVEPDPSTLVDGGKLGRNDTLPFTELYGDFSSQLAGKVTYITGLMVSSTAQGTLYYKYNSEAEPGAGVAQIENYYVRNVKPGQRDIRDVTFVPKTTFVGGEVTISYTAITEDGGNYSCKITIEVEPGGGGGEGSADNITLDTKYNSAVQFDANEFDRVCKERTGASLNYVTFATPPVRQGTLYTNYSGTSDYGRPVSTTTQYRYRDLNDIWFVPAPGYTGPVTIYYTGRSSGSPGKTYTGQVVIKVAQENSGANIGGLSYSITTGGTVRFDDEDFNDYCHDVLDSYQNISFLQFTAMPSRSEGVLYYDYRSTTSTGTPVAPGTVYYYGTRTPRLDRLTFVAAENFIGTVRIPFSAQSTDGTTFSGNVEINVRGGVGSGDIQYTCTPGRSVDFDDTHFNRLSRDLTGSALNYVMFQNLPGSSDGTLYYNNSTARTNTRYYNGSSNPRIDNLTFRASNSFSVVDIPFTGYATDGSSFNGVITISSDGSSAGSGGNIRYSTDSKSAAVFDRDDFDDLSQWETDRDISSVRFEIPSSSQGSLYRNYRSSSSQGTRITSSTSISASDLDRVAFVPASGYSGTVYIDFRATATGNGGNFNGTVEIDVERATADVTVRYSTRTDPVDFRASDFALSGRSLSSIRFGSMPSSNEGYLYYQYINSSNYGRQASIGTTYRVSGSNLISDLTFVPRVGYSGTVSIPYTGTNSNGSTFDGEVLITVSSSYNSRYFNDMAGYSAAQQAAVDYLYDHNITRGLSTGQYGPESHIRRGDFARMVYIAFGLSPSGTSGTFYDVPYGAYYAEAVNTLAARGIVSGTGGGYFSPDSALTRQDAICIVQRAMRATGWNVDDGSTSVLYSYGDGSSVSGYAQKAMAFAVQRGYLPTSGGRLSPTQPLTRVDMAEIIHRVLTY